jgi:hypothetical protein
MLDLKIIIGSTRPGRAADRVIPWITSAAREHGGFGVDVIDLRDWELPIFGETFATVGDIRNPTFSVPAVRQWNAKIAEAFGDDGQPGDHRTSAAVKILLDDLAWWAAALQQARARGTLPPAIMRLMGAQEGTGR